MTQCNAQVPSALVSSSRSVRVLQLRETTRLRSHSLVQFVAYHSQSTGVRSIARIATPAIRQRVQLCTRISSTAASGLQRTEPEIQRILDAKPSPNPSEKESLPEPSSSGGGEDDSSARQPFLERLLKGAANALFMRTRALMQGCLGFFSRESKWVLLLFLSLALLTTSMFSRTSTAPREVIYSDFRKLASQGHVKHVQIDESSGQIYFDAVFTQQQKQVSKRSWIPGRRNKVTQQIPEETASAQPLKMLLTTKRIHDPDLIPSLIESDINFGAVKGTLTGALSKAICSIFLLWAPLLPLIYLMRRTLGGKSSAKDKNKAGKGDQAPSVNFQDVAGIDTVKAELLEVVQCFRDATRYTRLNASMPSGVLLCGPPGTGKTLLAKAVAGEAGVPFFAAAASEFVELFVGRGAARVRDLFAEARKQAPCVVFIDELDAVGGRRGIGLNEERDQTLNQLLTELDGFDGRKGVLMLAATNRPEVLDSALTRPGRLSRKVVVPLPDEQGRAKIMAVHLRKTPMASQDVKEQSCAMVAKISAGMSGAELANVCNEAALLAGRRSAEVVEPSDLIDAVQRTRYGVNGGKSSILPASWQKKLNEFVVNSLSPSQRARTLPTSV